MGKIEHFDVALRLAGFGFKKQHVELIMDLYDKVSESEGGTTLEEVTKIITANEDKYESKK